MLYNGYVFILFSILKFSIWKEYLDLFDYRFVNRKTFVAINTLLLFASQIDIFALVFHPVLAFRALEKEHFSFILFEF